MFDEEFDFKRKSWRLTIREWFIFLTGFMIGSSAVILEIFQIIRDVRQSL